VSEAVVETTIGIVVEAEPTGFATMFGSVGAEEAGADSALE